MLTFKTVMVVDDEADIRSAIGLYLVRHGYHCVEAGSALEARLLLDSGVCPDLIVLDIMMPGTSGRDFLNELRKHRKSQVPIVMLSALGGSDDVIGTYNDGADFHLVKPFRPPMLLYAIDYLIGDLTPEEMIRVETKLLTERDVFFGYRTLVSR